MPLQGRPLRDFVGETWEILTNLVPREANISYGDLLEELIGERRTHPDQLLRPILDFLTGYCIGSGAPPLTVLVVNDREQMPGAGFAELVPGILAARRDVLNYDWRNHPLPPAL